MQKGLENEVKKPVSYEELEKTVDKPKIDYSYSQINIEKKVLETPHYERKSLREGGVGISLIVSGSLIGLYMGDISSKIFGGILVVGGIGILVCNSYKVRKY